MAAQIASIPQESDRAKQREGVKRLMDFAATDNAMEFARHAHFLRYYSANEFLDADANVTKRMKLLGDKLMAGGVYNPHHLTTKEILMEVQDAFEMIPVGKK